MSMVAGGGAWMQQPRAFQSETYFFAARVVAQGRATACLRHDKSSSTLRKSVRLPRQRALFLPFNHLFVFVWRFTRPVRVLSCLSPPPHEFGPAAITVELVKLIQRCVHSS